MKYQPLPTAVKSVLAICIVIIAALLSDVDRASAAEFHLRAQCNPAGVVVTLGDVAEVSGADARQAAALAAIELFPAPSVAEQRVIRVREIQDLLMLKGVNLTEHRFSGASEVTFQTIAARPQVVTNISVSAGQTQRIKRRVSEAVVKYLNERAGGNRAWTVNFNLTEAQARLLADPVRPMTITGGCDPWTGSQRFEVAIAGPKEPARATIDVKVQIIAPVVVAIRPLARGAVIREGDVELQTSAAEKSPSALHAVEEAIGHELVRALPTGGAVSADSLRAPLAVHRGEVVTVYAQSGAVRIRTNARSRDEGSVGELVAVESLLNRSTYYARVSGVREVEVYARPTHADNQSADRGANLVNR